MLIPDPRRTPLPNLISHNGIILYQWEFLRARLDEGEGLPWIAMDCMCCMLHVGDPDGGGTAVPISKYKGLLAKPL